MASEETLHPDDLTPPTPEPVKGRRAKAEPAPEVPAKVVEPAPAPVVRKKEFQKFDRAKVRGLPKVAEVTNTKGDPTGEVVVHAFASAGGTAFGIVEHPDGSLTQVSCKFLKFKG